MPRRQVQGFHCCAATQAVLDHSAMHRTGVRNATLREKPLASGRVHRIVEVGAKLDTATAVEGYLVERKRWEGCPGGVNDQLILVRQVTPVLCGGVGLGVALWPNA